jgi:hypothetical protein
VATFEIEQYELHAMTYRVKADTLGEAVVKLLQGHGEPLDDTLDFIQVCTDKGMTADSVPDIATHLAQAGIDLGGLAVPVIPSIREAYQVG